MRLTFLGAAGTVTGSCTLVDHGGRRVLVDCGLFQGLKQLRLRNWAPPAVEPGQLDAVALTHAHIDHSGLLPRLFRLGLRAPIHCTPSTFELARILLPDSGRLQEEEAEYANRKGYSKHRPALPLYTESDARRVLELFRPIAFDEVVEPVPGWRCSLTRAGHILGAASVRLDAGGLAVLFSGDLGRDDDLLFEPPQPPPAADAVVIESTYGDRLHGRSDVLVALEQVIRRTVARGGAVIVPAFAVGRAQALLLCLERLREAGRIPTLPVYLNSPMAVDVTRVFVEARGEHRLDERECDRMCRGVRFVNSVEESRQLNARRGPMVIVSASGMATGGRVLHHLRAFGPDPRNTILFAGYQAAGTRGAAIVHGADAVKIHGQYVPIRAEVVCLDQLSAHADREQLLHWLAAVPRMPQRVFVTHGEPTASDRLRAAIGERLGWEALVPEHRSTHDVDSAAA